MKRDIFSITGVIVGIIFSAVCLFMILPITIIILIFQYENISYPDLSLIHFILLLFGSIINTAFPRRSYNPIAAAHPHVPHEEHHEEHCDHHAGHHEAQETINDGEVRFLILFCFF